jgi:hypothetical protein
LEIYYLSTQFCHVLINTAFFLSTFSFKYLSPLLLRKQKKYFTRVESGSSRIADPDRETDRATDSQHCWRVNPLSPKSIKSK